MLQVITLLLFYPDLRCVCLLNIIADWQEGAWLTVAIYMRMKVAFFL